MVNIMENPIKMDDLGGKPTIFGNTQIYFSVTLDLTEPKKVYHALVFPSRIKLLQLNNNH